MVNLEVVDPISLILYLCNDIGISISEKDVQQYWRHHRQFGAKWALHSQATEETVPLGLYGDSVKVRSTYQGVEKWWASFCLVRYLGREAVAAVGGYFLLAKKNFFTNITRWTVSICTWFGI